MAAPAAAAAGRRGRRRRGRSWERGRRGPRDAPAAVLARVGRARVGRRGAARELAHLAKGHERWHRRLHEAAALGPEGHEDGGAAGAARRGHAGVARAREAAAVGVCAHAPRLRHAPLRRTEPEPTTRSRRGRRAHSCVGRAERTHSWRRSLWRGAASSRRPGFLPPAEARPPRVARRRSSRSHASRRHCTHCLCSWSYAPPAPPTKAAGGLRGPPREGHLNARG